MKKNSITALLLFLFFVANAAWPEIQHLIIDSNGDSRIHYVYDFPNSAIHKNLIALRFHQYLDSFSKRYYADLSIKCVEDNKDLPSVDLYKIELITGEGAGKSCVIPIQGVFFGEDQGVVINFDYFLKEAQFKDSKIKFYFRFGKTGKSELAEYIMNFTELKKATNN